MPRTLTIQTQSLRTVRRFPVATGRIRTRDHATPRNTLCLRTDRSCPPAPVGGHAAVGRGARNLAEVWPRHAGRVRTRRLRVDRYDAQPAGAGTAVLARAAGSRQRDAA